MFCREATTPTPNLLLALGGAAIPSHKAIIVVEALVLVLLALVDMDRPEALIRSLTRQAGICKDHLLERAVAVEI